MSRPEGHPQVGGVTETNDKAGRRCLVCGEMIQAGACPGCDGEAIAALKDRVAALEAELGVTSAELALTRGEVVAQTRAKEAALAEVERLKAGRFTEEEFQELCHSAPPGDGVARFRGGCLEYQRRLFGDAAVRCQLAREMLWSLRRLSTDVRRGGLDDLVEAMATALVEVEPPRHPAEVSGPSGQSVKP